MSIMGDLTWWEKLVKVPLKSHVELIAEGKVNSAKDGGRMGSNHIFVFSIFLMLLAFGALLTGERLPSHFWRQQTTC